MTIDVARQVDGGRDLIPMRWAHPPSWWKRPVKELPSTLNVRRDGRRKADVPCGVQFAVPSSVGVLCVEGQAGAKVPHYFSSPEGRPLAFAGLWESWRDSETEETVLPGAIIVGAANEWMSRFHDRMPVLLETAAFDAWLTGDTSLGELLQPPPEDALQEWIVSWRVNRSDVGNDDPGVTVAVEVKMPGDDQRGLSGARGGLTSTICSLGPSSCDISHKAVRGWEPNSSGVSAVEIRVAVGQQMFYLCSRSRYGLLYR